MKKILFSCFLIATLGATGAAASAGSLQTLAWRLSVDSATLAEAARDQRFELGGPTGEVITRLDILHEAAVRFDTQIRLGAGDSAEAAAAFRELIEAYRLAKPSFDHLKGTQDVRAAIWRTRDTLTNLAAAYRQNAAFYGDPVPPADAPPTAPPPVIVAPREPVLPYYDEWRLRQMAADMVRMSAHLAGTARGMQLRGLVSQGAAERFQVLHRAAEAFYEQVVAYGSAITSITRGYVDLVYSLQEARDVAGDFNLNVQRDLGVVWDLALQLNGIAPQTSLGTYSLHDFHR